MLPMFIAAAVACSDNDNSSSGNFINVDLTCNPNVINVGYEAGAAQLNVTANREWGLYTPHEWIKCTPTSTIKETEIVDVTIAENSTRSERTGYIIFMSGARRGGRHDRWLEGWIRLDEGGRKQKREEQMTSECLSHVISQEHELKQRSHLTLTSLCLTGE